MYLGLFSVGLHPRLKAVAPMVLLLQAVVFEPLRDVEAGTGAVGVLIVAVDGGDGVLFLEVFY